MLTCKNHIYCHNLRVININFVDNFYQDKQGTTTLNKKIVFDSDDEAGGAVDDYDDDTSDSDDQDISTTGQANKAAKLTKVLVITLYNKYRRLHRYTYVVVIL